MKRSSQPSLVAHTLRTPIRKLRVGVETTRLRGTTLGLFEDNAVLLASLFMQGIFSSFIRARERACPLTAATAESYSSYWQVARARSDRIRTAGSSAANTLLAQPLLRWRDQSTQGNQGSVIRAKGKKCRVYQCCMSSQCCLVCRQLRS